MTATPAQRTHHGLAPVIPLRPRDDVRRVAHRTPPPPAYRGLHDDLVRLHEMEQLADSMVDPATRIRLTAVVDEAFARILEAAFPDPAFPEPASGRPGPQGRADAAPRSAARPRALRGS